MRSWLNFDFNYFVNELKPMFKKQYLRDDIFAGLTVACVAIPLSLAVAMASHLEPGVGLISAIIGSIIAAFFGGTRLAVTGPAAAMAVLIASCVETFGVAGLLVIGLICGFLQLIVGLLGLGRFAKLVPLPVISAFTAGIGFIIFIGQLPKALQLPAPDQNDVLAVIKHIGSYILHMNPMAFVLALITVIILKVMPRYFPKLPTPLIAVAIPTAIVYFGHLNNITLVGIIPHHLSLPQLPNFAGINDWPTLIESALEVFILASLETLLSSSAVDNMGKGDLHNSNQELIGQGMANLGVTLFGGLPVTGVIARSSVNIAAGAKTRRSPLIHALAILAVVYFCPQLVEMIPVAALAGILLAAAMSMMNIKELVEFWKTDKSEVAIYIITFIMIVSTDLIDGVKAGIIVAFIIVGLRMLQTKSSVKLWTNEKVLRIELSGDMTFWSFEKISKIKSYIVNQKKLKVVIFEFAQLRGMDSSGALHLINLAKELKNNTIKVIFNRLDQQQEKVFQLAEPSGDSYIKTNNEVEIKDQLELSGIEHRANEMLKHNMAKFLDQNSSNNKLMHDILESKPKPHTLVIACADSNISSEALLSGGLGELFVVKNMGNLIPKYNKEQLDNDTNTIEYALTELKIQNIVICGHVQCKTLKSIINSSHDNNCQWNKNAKYELSNYLANHSNSNLEQLIHNNILQQMQNLNTYPVVQDLLANKQLTITAWFYDEDNSKIFEWNGNNFVPIINN
jgi:carbonic anhydrase